MNETSAGVPADLTLERAVRVLDLTLGTVLAALMFAMMLLTFTDVVGRQGFDSPVRGSNELTQIAMGMLVYIGLPLVCLRREHITIGLLSGLLRGRVHRVQHVVLNLLLSACTFVWARQVWIQAEALTDSNAVLMFLQVSVAPYVFAMSVLTFFSGFLFVGIAWCYLRGATVRTGGEVA